MWLPDNFKPHAWFVIDFQRRARGLREAAQRDNGCPGQGLPQNLTEESARWAGAI